MRAPFALLAMSLLMQSCHSGSPGAHGGAPIVAVRTPVTPIVVAAPEREAEPEVAPREPTPPMDEAFRREIAPILVLQTRSRRWGELLPRDGTLLTSSGHVSLADDGKTGAAYSRRACSRAALEREAGDLVTFLVAELEAKDRADDDGRFACARTTCSVHGGEMGWSGSLELAREGGSVRLVSISRYDGSALDDESRAALAADAANVVPAAPCSSVRR